MRAIPVARLLGAGVHGQEYRLLDAVGYRADSPCRRRVSFGRRARELTQDELAREVRTRHHVLLGDEVHAVLERVVTSMDGPAAR